jgi:hypothetical protein
MKTEKGIEKMRKLTEEEVAAMWLMGDEYSGQSLGIVDFYEQLPEARKQMVRNFLAALAEAR